MPQFQDSMGLATFGPRVSERTVSYAAHGGLEFPPPAQPRIVVPSINKLTETLGLAGSVTPIIDAPVPNYRDYGPRVSNSLSNAQTGKLLNRALNTALTADDVAHYVSNRSESSGETVIPSRPIHDSSAGESSTAREGEYATKVVHAPPGFANEGSRVITVEQQVPSPPTKMPAVAEGYFNKTRQVFGRSTLGSRRESEPFIRGYPRRYTQTRRGDQGPEPSLADIYPEDVNWAPPPTTRQDVPTIPSEKPQLTEFNLLTRGTQPWYDPGEEVHQEPTTIIPIAPAAQRSRILESHAQRAKEDFKAADQNVVALLDLLPGLSATTQHDAMAPDNRPLTPRQEDGKRYGLRYHGVGIQNAWDFPPIANGQSWTNPGPFRVRPMDHAGWGGQEWAQQMGWA